MTLLNGIVKTFTHPSVHKQFPHGKKNEKEKKKKNAEKEYHKLLIYFKVDGLRITGTLPGKATFSFS